MQRRCHKTGRGAASNMMQEGGLQRRPAGRGRAASQRWQRRCHMATAWTVVRPARPRRAPRVPVDQAPAPGEVVVAGHGADDRRSGVLVTLVRTRFKASRVWRFTYPSRRAVHCTFEGAGRSQLPARCRRAVILSWPPLRTPLYSPPASSAEDPEPPPAPPKQPLRLRRPGVAERRRRAPPGLRSSSCAAPLAATAREFEGKLVSAIRSNMMAGPPMLKSTSFVHVVPQSVSPLYIQYPNPGLAFVNVTIGT
jgi:hypothetical protein